MTQKALSGKKSVFSGVNRVRVSDLVIAFIVLLLSLTCVLPFIYILAKSLSSNTAVLSQKVFLWPVGFNVNAYSSIFRDGKMTHSLLYTAEVTLLFTVIGMLITICAAYPLSIKGLKFKGFFSFILMFTMYFSAGLIPEYLLMKDLKLLNTMWSLVLPLTLFGI
jgi:ABC-type sugar transport system, permease component